ncbi:bifunctional biotin--[acetyl-CoA-carboxylase] ligase/biotin operon repressor BirA [Glaciecola sp. KUL10]|uniref:bifunctional biotin--[acetyl-CoA-carboxylase] ligase/biotin operon repressor BirA n=1 Tax=Glaciecola sp. (strain KUL10) TaxID=2161813 RepID=UPI000D78604A|nr:bifunctional biotin--[acetyl-CoA-carboxylase] ligase/biotin operon repressor BirA [Glaciecola sp. KUL10]GBL06130.1 BirA family transcriptional regulator, biotin operon repressor [Glaciecola sp. KUL10]
MKKAVEQTRTSLIQILANGEFHSGQVLGERLGISRAAIANHIKALQSLGIEVFSVRGRGYKLDKPLNMLSADKILENTKFTQRNQLHIANIIASTNDYIKDHLSNLSSGFCCIAEAQTKGRGRRGRTWVSPYGANIYLSMNWKFSGGYQSIAGLSLLIGLSINRTLNDIGINSAKLKWPNDVYINSKKLAGILVEVEGQVGGDTHAIIGLGLNVSMPTDTKGIDQPFIDLQSLSSTHFDRNEIVAYLLNHLNEMLVEFERCGLTPFLDEYKASDLFCDKPVRLISGTNEVLGISRGINETGALLVEIDGVISAHYGGEISGNEISVRTQ